MCLRDRLIYQSGIARCGASEFEKLDRRHVIRYRKSGYGVEALVSHREAVRRSRPDLVVDRATLEAVSYTHLDVYKRQPLWSKAWLHRTRTNSRSCPHRESHSFFRKHRISRAT